MDPVALASEMAAIFPRLSPEIQQAYVYLLREHAGVHLDPSRAFDRAESLLRLSEEAGGLANRLLDAVDQELLR